jgi:response regulator RpfG family c-di-GMP phosphodiesterase
MTTSIANSRPQLKGFVILVVEDDTIFRKMMVRCLESEGHEVYAAENGLVAKDLFLLHAEQIQLVVSDIRMVGMDGIDLLTHVRKTSSVPFLLMTGFAEIIEIQDAYKLGVAEFIAKPFETKALKAMVRRCLDPETEVNVESSDGSNAHSQKFCPIHIDEFEMFIDLQSDIYVRLGAKRFVKIAHKGSLIPKDRLRSYKEKKITHVYVTEADFSEYVKMSTELFPVSGGSPSASAKLKFRILRHAAEIILGKCFLEGLEPGFVEPAHAVIDEALKLVLSDPSGLDLVESLTKLSDRMYAHSLAVSVYSCIVAQKQGHAGKDLLSQLAIAGVLHDIGEREISSSILTKDEKDWTSEEVRLYESHPSRGRELILGLKSLPEDVSRIVFQHHERENGDGFPLALKGEHIHPLAILLGTIDDFIKLVLPTSLNKLALQPRTAIAKLRKSRSSVQESAYLDGLMEVFDLKDPGTSNSSKS